MKNKFRCMTCQKLTTDNRKYFLDLSKELSVAVCTLCATVIYNHGMLIDNEEKRLANEKRKNTKKRKSN